MAWRIEDGAWSPEVTVPEGCTAEVVLPDGATYEVGKGTHRF